jgi:Lon protease-like protein
VSSSPPPFDAALDALPLFPLPDVVLYPGVRMPLHVFEPRYRAMLADVLATHRSLAIVRLLPGEDERGLPRIAGVAGGGVILEHQSLPDGRSNILVEGIARLSLEELPFEPPYRRARARVLEDTSGEVPASQHAALVSAATSFARAVRKHDPSFSLRVPDDPDSATLADMCAFQLLVDADVRQRVLEDLRPASRVRLVVEELMVQAAALSRSDPDASRAN